MVNVMTEMDFLELTLMLKGEYFGGGGGGGDWLLLIL